MKLRWPALLATTLCALTAGCVETYYPMRGFARPVAIDVSYANFTGLDIVVRCWPSRAAPAPDTNLMCQKLGRLFENQGARVTVQRGRQVDEDGAPVRRPDLRVDLRSRLIDEKTIDFVFWTERTDYTFAQEIEIRDGVGFLLARETFMARFVSRLGWSSDAARLFSKDFYGHLSQLALNANVRREVLAESAAAAAELRAPQVIVPEGAPPSSGGADARPAKPEAEGAPAIGGVLGVISAEEEAPSIGFEGAVIEEIVEESPPSEGSNP